MKPQCEVPLICWRRGYEGCDGGPERQRAARKGERLGEWKDLCPMHAAAVSYVLMAETEDSFRRWYEDACREFGSMDALAAVEAQGRALEVFILEPAKLAEPAELFHNTDGGRAALLFHSCVTMERGEWRDEIRMCRTELCEVRGELDSVEARMEVSNEALKLSRAEITELESRCVEYKELADACTLMGTSSA